MLFCVFVSIPFTRMGARSRGVYAVCTEGELFYSPMYEDGSVNFEEFEIVDFWDSEIDPEELEKIQSVLIDMMQIAGLYFKSMVPV